MKKFISGTIFAVLIMGVFIACKKESATESKKALSGDWILTIQTIGGDAPTTMVLKNNYTFYTDHDPADGEVDLEGTWFLNGDHFTALAPVDDFLSMEFTGELQADKKTIQGTYTLKSDQPHVTGDFKMEKQ